MLEVILITEQLESRNQRSANYKAENQALRALSRQLVQFETLLQNIVDMALELGGAQTAGVSLLEMTPSGEEVFRWNVIAGTLKQHVGAITPRNFSTCGICLDCGTPQLFSYPERYFTYLQAANTPIVEHLVLPLIADNHVFGTIWIQLHDSTRHFDCEDVRLMTSLAEFTTTALSLNQQQSQELPALNASALRESSELSRALIENLPGGAVFVVDHDLRYLLAEGEALSQAGFKPEDFVGHTIFSVLQPELAANYEVVYRQALAGELFEFEHNAHGRSYVSRGTPLRDGNGKVYAALGVSYDISDRKQAENALRESEEKYRTLFNSMDEGFCSIEVLYDSFGQPVDHRILEANPAFEKQTGLKNASGRLASELMPLVEQYWNDLYGRIVATGSSERVEQYSPAFDRWFDVEVSRVGDESLRCVAVIFWDISDRKQTEVALRVSEERLQTAQKAGNVGLWDWDAASGKTYWSETMWALYGYESQPDKTGDEIWESNQHPEDQQRVNESIAQFLASNEIDYRDEFRIIQPNGSVRWIESVAQLIRDEAGKPVRMSGVNLDITDRKQAEAALAHSRRQFEKIAATTPDLVYVFDLVEERNIFVNAGIHRVLGYSQAQIATLGSSLIAHLIHPDDISGVIEGNQRFRNLGDTEVYDHELRMRHATGEYRWLRCRDAVFERTADGTVTQTIGTAQDITDRKKAEATLRESEARQAFLLRLSDVLRSLADPVEIQEAVTQTAINYFGADRCYYCEIIDSNAIVRRDASQEDLPSVVGVYPLNSSPIFKAMIDAGQPFVVQDTHTTNLLDETLRQTCLQLQIISFINVPVIKQEEPVGILAITQGTPRNWTEFEMKLVEEIAERTWAAVERTRAEAALRESEEKYRTLFNSIDEGYLLCEVIFDENNKPTDIFYLEANPAAVRLAGQDFTGQRMREIDPNYEDYWYEIIGRVALTGETVRAAHYAEPHERWFDFCASKVGGQESRRVASIFQDITDRKRREANLAFLAETSLDLVHLTNVDETMNRLGEKIGRHFNVARVVFAEISEDQETGRVSHEWHQADLPDMRGSYRTKEYFSPEFERLHRAGEIAVVRDAATDERVDADGYAALGIGAFVGVPLVRADKWRFYFSLLDSAPRNWTDDEIELTHELAARIWTRLERARAEAALRASEARLAADLAGMRRLYDLHRKLALETNLHTALAEILATACEFTTTDRGCVQLVSDDGEWLEMFAWHGYGDDSLFINHFRHEGSKVACDTARRQRDRLIIKDVENFPPLAGTRDREVALAEDIRATQSTPLITRQGEMVGVLNVQFSQPHRSTDDELRLIDLLAWTAADFVARHRAEQAVRESQERLSIAIEAAQMGIWEWDIVNDVATRSLRHDQILGYETLQAEWGEQTMKRHILEADHKLFNDAIAHARETGDLEFNVRVRWSDGSIHWIADRGRFYFDDEGNAIRAAGVTLDITDRKRAEAERIQLIQEQAAREEERQRAEALAELDRAKTLFFSNVSHEFRTPLTLSLAPLQDALSDSVNPLAPPHRERLELAHRNSLRLLKLVNTLLDFSRIEAGRMEAVYEATDLALLTTELASVFRSAIERAGLQFNVDCPPLPEPVYVDREMWEKIVLNLLSNAFKFTLEGEIVVRLYQYNDRYVTLQVQDTGAGISAEELPHIFERFYHVRTTQARTHEGSGIGLALAQELIKMHGGTVEVSSVVGQGSCFTVKIPLGTAHLPADRIKYSAELKVLSAEIEERKHYSSLNTRTDTINRVSTLSTQHSALITHSTLSTNSFILLVDDNADMRDYLKRILSEHVQVEAVADGAAAMAIIEERVPDLVLSDVMMPHLDGFGLLKALRADPRTKEVPIILLSARAGEESVIEGLQAGADDYLIKPFSATELVTRVLAHLQLAQLRAEALHREKTSNRMKDKILAEVSHELQAPLVSILGWTRLLRSSPSNQSMLVRALETIERNATLQAKLIQDLLDISRITSGKISLNKAPVELHSVIESALATVHQAQKAKDICLECILNPESVTVEGDADRLQQIVLNLLTNAIKFTPEGGIIEVYLGVTENQAQIEVRDTGIGIEPEFLPYIFETFRQSKNSKTGLGLGLAIARQLVQLHSGTLTAKSDGTGQGATFTIKLPLINVNL